MRWPAPCSGWLGQALGFRRQVLLGLLAIVVTNLLGAAAGSAGWLLAARAGEGLGFVLVVLAAPGLLTEVTGAAHRRLVVGAWGVYMPLGTGLATLVVPVAIAAVGWRGAWLIDAAVTAAVLLAVARWVPTSPARRPPGLGGLSRAVRSPGVMCLAVAFGFYAGAYLAVVGLLPTMLVGGGLSLAAAGLVTSIVSLANVPANLLGAVLQHRGVPRWVLLVAGSAWIALTVWGVLDPALPLAGPHRVRRWPSRWSSASSPRPRSAGWWRCRRGPPPRGRRSACWSRGRASVSSSGPPLVVGVEHRRRLLGRRGRDAHRPRRRACWPAGCCTGGWRGRSNRPPRLLTRLLTISHDDR